MFFSENLINAKEWPAQSPDLNPRFENLSTYIKKGVSAIQPNSVEDLCKVVQKIWGSVTVERCEHLVDSMGKRNAVIANKDTQQNTEKLFEINLKDIPVKYFNFVYFILF